MTGSEVSVGVAAAGIAALICDTTKTGSRSALGKAIQIVSKRNQRAIFQAAGNYFQAYQAAYCQLSVLGMRDPVSLSSVYTDVKLLDREGMLAFKSAASKGTFRQARLRGSTANAEKDQSVLGIAIANQSQYLMVLGESGAGKSTFLQKVGWEALRTFGPGRSAYHHRLIPVLLVLNHFEGDDIDLEQFIVSEFEQWGLPAAEMFVQNALAQGNLLILLDGLDEAPSAHLGKVLLAMQSFVDRYRGNRFMVTGGVAAAGDGEAFQRNRTPTFPAFQRFRKVTLAAFDDEQIQQFMVKWFSCVQVGDSGSAQKCWQALQTADNRASKALARTPLLLTYLCLLYGSSQRFPANRSLLYQSVLRDFLEKESPENQSWRNDSAGGVTYEKQERFLAEIAYKGMAANQTLLSKQELSAQIKAFVAHNQNEPISPDNEPDNEAVLKALVKLPGILVTHTQETYAFSHPLLQAYLTAQYLVDNQEWEWFIQLYLTDRRWREVFLLLPGLMRSESDVDKLLLAIEEQSRVYLRSHQLQQLLYWAETSVQNSAQNSAQDSAQDSSLQSSVTTSKLAAKRIAAVFIALALTRALALAPDLDIAVDLDLALDLDLSLDLVLALALAFARALARALALAKALDVEVDLDLDSALCLDLDLDIAVVLVRAGIFLEVDFDEWVRSLESLTTEKPQVNASRAAKQPFIEKFDQLWFSPFGLNADIAMLSQADSQALLDYFYACELMMRCQESALHVSSDLWAAIESRIFTGVASGLPAP